MTLLIHSVAMSVERVVNGLFLKESLLEINKPLNWEFFVNNA